MNATTPNWLKAGPAFTNEARVGLFGLYSGVLHGSGASALEPGRNEKEWISEREELVVIVSPPLYHGELDKWDD